MKKRISLWLALIMTVELLCGGMGMSIAAADEGVLISKLQYMKTVPFASEKNVVRAPVFQVTFNESVKVDSDTRAPKIVIKEKDKDRRIVDTIEQGAASIKMDASNKTVSFELQGNKRLDFGTDYILHIDEAFFKSVATDKPSSEISIEFTTAAQKVEYSPSPDSYNADPLNALQIRANEMLSLGTGKIGIYRLSDNAPIDVYNIKPGVTDPRVKVEENLVRLLSPAITTNTSYYVLIDAGALLYADDKNLDGITNARQWTFTTRGDTSIMSKSPQSGTTNVSSNTKLQLTFNKNVFPAQGNIDVYQANGTKVSSIPALSTQVTGGGSQVITINPQMTLQSNSNYYVLVSNGAFRDSTGNEVAGIVSTSGWTFSTTVDTASQLTISSFSPVDRSSSVALDSDLTITFNREVLKGAGSVKVRKSGSTTNVPVNVIANGTRDVRIVLQSGTKYEADSTYYVNIDNNAFYDARNTNNYFAGLNGTSAWTFQTYVSDKLAPVLQSSQMYNNTTIILTYNELLDTSVWPLITSFKVTVNDENRSIGSVYTSGENVYISLDTGVAVGQNVKVSYSGGLRPIQDVAKNQAAVFSSRDVVNGIDTALPKPKEGNISGSTVRLYFSQSLKSTSTYAYDQFTVTADGSSMGVKDMTISGQTITLYLNTTVSDGQIVKVTYKPGSNPVLDSRGQEIASFSDFNVRNYFDTKPPVFQKAEGGAAKVILSYNEFLSQTYLPMKSQFSVLMNGVPNYVNAVEVKENQVILTLASALLANTKLTISYVPGTSRLTDLNGNAAGYINLEPITISIYAQVPDLKNVIVQGDTVQFVFSKLWNSQISLTTSQFLVYVDGVLRNVTLASVNESTITLKLSSSVSIGQKVEVSYTPGISAIRDPLGIYLAAFSKLAVSNGIISTPSTSTGDVSRPEYLTTMEASAFGRVMFTLGTGAFTSSDVKSRYEQYVKMYTVNSDKLKKAFEYIIISKESTHTVVVEAPASINTLYVSISLQTLEEIYNIDRNASIAVKAGDALYYLQLKQVNFAEIARNLNTTTTAGLTLSIQVEKVPNSSNTAQNILNAGTIQQITDPVNFNVAVASGVVSANSPEIKLFGEYLIRTTTPLTNDKSGLVQQDALTGKWSFVPTVIESSGNLKIFHAKVKGNMTVMGISNDKYYGDLGNHWAKDVINTLSSKLIMEGRSNTTFEPNSKITRAEFAEYIARALGLPGDVQTAQRFTDLFSPSASAYIGAAAKAGIVVGFKDGTFKPNNYITREQMAIMMVRVMNYAGYNTTLSGTPADYLRTFKDSKSIQAPEAAAKALKEGIIQGVTTNTFQPKGYATRAQAAVMLKRLLSKIGYI
ncbi:SwmB domain-containing protein [Paenibacillus pini]